MAGLADRLLSALAYIEPPERAQEPPKRRYELPDLPTSPLPLRAPTSAGGGFSPIRPSEDTGAPVRPHGSTVYVGDSLGVGTAPNIHGLKRQDVLGGRSSASGVQALRGMLRHRPAGTIVFDLGTNDPNRAALARSIKQTRKLADGARIVIPTVRGPHAAAKNRLIRHLEGSPDIEVVDWAAAPDRLVSGDRIHATPGGYRRRARMIRRAF